MTKRPVAPFHEHHPPQSTPPRVRLPTPAPHPFHVPPGMAYAAREANKALAARLAREERLFDVAFHRGAERQRVAGSSDQ